MLPAPLTIEPSQATCEPGLVPSALQLADADRVAETLKALAEPARLKLLSIIATQQDAGACVCDLTGSVGLSQPTVSHHLKVLVEAGFLSRSKRGTWAYYRIVPGSLDAVASSLRLT